MTNAFPKSRKSIKGVRASDGVTRVARKSLKQRLKEVRKLLPLVRRCWSDDPEYVHQLRVAIRRLEAVLRLFGDVFSRKRKRQLNEQVKRLRQAAGAARDLDVLQSQLLDVAAQQSGERVVEPLRAHLTRKRRELQKSLNRACRRIEAAKFQRLARRTLKSVRWRGRGGEPELREEAQRRLGRHVTAFFSEAAEHPQAPDELHRLRILAKRLRYSLEICRPALSNEFREAVYPRFCELQDCLGQINDAHTAAGIFHRWAQDWPDHSPTWERCEQSEHDRMRKQVELFQRQWDVQILNDLRTRFQTALTSE